MADAKGESQWATEGSGCLTGASTPRGDFRINIEGGGEKKKDRLLAAKEKIPPSGGSPMADATGGGRTERGVRVWELCGKKDQISILVCREKTVEIGGFFRLFYRKKKKRERKKKMGTRQSHDEKKGQHNRSSSQDAGGPLKKKRG